MSAPESDFEDAAAVLVLSPRDVGAKACADLLERTPGGLDRLLIVAISDDPAAWETRLDDRPALDGTAVSYVDVRTLRHGDDDGPTPVETVRSPADLNALGTAINDVLSDAAAAGERVGLCVYSISEMLAFVDRELVFKLLHTVGARLRREDHVAYFHLDGDTGDEELETLFSHLSDAVVSIDDHGMTVSPGYYAVAPEDDDLPPE
ncbi:hypothetical protein GJ629_13670 [Halapricum sp. CBA1109]|uniref:DUF7504 family protein n=1 Tax=Halapricum sp. CBA1109 TaxID=2668068 RepID=UPI0012F8960B|nr:hypothetical protein [Halapricum sp. CBA1109]MUV90819.1 hypothetical protein [Halapricum sp. CBA1109]